MTDINHINKSLEMARPAFGPGIEPELPCRSITSPNLLSSGGRWWQCSSPFCHFRATDVFDMSIYKALCQQFSLILEDTKNDNASEYKMRRAKGNNDCLILGLNDELASVFYPLFTEEWLRSLADLLDLKFLPRIEGALHSNPINSQTGWIHTDCCSAWFDECDIIEDKLMFPPRKRCSYFTGKRMSPNAEPKEYIRAATMIFYLCNEGWQQGDGGETALYSTSEELEHTTVKRVPPLNNSLFLFECSPHSYHRFISNPGRVRNSIILWLHSSVEDAEARWGDGINRKDYR